MSRKQEFNNSFFDILYLAFVKVSHQMFDATSLARTSVSPLQQKVDYVQEKLTTSK